MNNAKKTLLLCLLVGAFLLIVLGYTNITGYQISQPNAPEALIAFAGDKSVSLRWRAPSCVGNYPCPDTSILYYEIWRSDSSGKELFYDTTCLDEPIPCNKTSVTYYVDTNVQNGKTYFYVVYARNSNNRGLPSSEVSATPNPVPDTTPPKILSASPVNESVNISSSAKIKFYFSETMDRNETEAAFSITPTVQGTFVWTFNSRNLTFVPNTLNKNIMHNISISTAATDKAKNNLTSNYSFYFTTESPPVGTTTTTSTMPTTTTTTTSPPIQVDVVSEPDAFAALVHANATISAPQTPPKNITEALHYYNLAVDAYNSQKYGEAKNLAKLAENSIKDFAQPASTGQIDYTAVVIAIILILGAAGAIYYYTKIRKVETK